MPTCLDFLQFIGQPRDYEKKQYGFAPANGNAAIAYNYVFSIFLKILNTLFIFFY